MFTKAKRAFIDPTPRYITREPEPGDPECECGETYPVKRKELGFDTCLSCARPQLKLANCAMHKQAYGYVSDVSVLKENQYGSH